MSAAVTVVVAAGLVVVIALSLTRGVDAVAIVLLVLIAAMGATGVAVARRANRGSVAPASCPECNGLVSPHAPYCKHCGASLGGDGRL